MFGINGAEALVLLLVALLVIGPERLPGYAEQLGTWVRSLRSFVSTTKERVASELGEEAAEVDWASLDPRRYDPRRIVREALLDDPKPVSLNPGVRAYVTGPGASTTRPAPAATRRPGTPDADEATPVAPFDDEAT
ncbi:twin-arginine translocase TatA/TatE family subunit [Actinotalea sp. K2]|uniref:twin-arginine translocase TatA/TatE family subunit n=1 Tax=Actinotalea sp. K2 TaxID=2939438 RepID=UPI0020175B32|nr:twin-arginine translocase TatA/TatE family subunit [Actinotalea sp. K2]MCL3862609.1 twin-arginine translocase TatA/TatE family subunit [Actinotalea sp. K2]